MRRRKITKGRFIRATLDMTPADRLDFYSIPEPNSGCQLWMGSVASHGYGALEVNKVAWLAHRLAWALLNGPIPTGLIVCHKCDNRLCINPNHMFLGTNADNMADMVSKRRSNFGERNGSRKLTANQVSAILRASGSNTSIASRFGVTRHNIGMIRRRLTWKHIDG